MLIELPVVDFCWVGSAGWCEPLGLFAVFLEVGEGGFELEVGLGGELVQGTAEHLNLNICY